MAGKKMYVVRGASLKCSLGSMSCRIMIPLSHGVYIGGKPQLNIEDYKTGANISHFGMCYKIPDKPVPCVAQCIGPWKGGQGNKLIAGSQALTTNCTNTCLRGGVISIEEHHQK